MNKANISCLYNLWTEYITIKNIKKNNNKLNFLFD